MGFRIIWYQQSLRHNISGSEEHSQRAPQRTRGDGNLFLTFQPQKFGEGIHSTDESTLTEDVQTMQIDRHTKTMQSSTSVKGARQTTAPLTASSPLHCHLCLVTAELQSCNKRVVEIEVSNTNDFAKSAAPYKK